MRFGRILLAGLGPLFALSALVAVAGALQPGSSSPQNAFASLLQSVAHLGVPVAENASVTVSSERPSPQAILAFAALADTPFRHSLWMVAGSSVPQAPRLPNRTLLRC